MTKKTSVQHNFNENPNELMNKMREMGWSVFYEFNFGGNNYVHAIRFKDGLRVPEHPYKLADSLNPCNALRELLEHIERNNF